MVAYKAQGNGTQNSYYISGITKNCGVFTLFAEIFLTFVKQNVFLKI